MCGDIAEHHHSFVETLQHYSQRAVGSDAILRCKPILNDFIQPKPSILNTFITEKLKKKQVLDQPQIFKPIAMTGDPGGDFSENAQSLFPTTSICIPTTSTEPCCNDSSSTRIYCLSLFWTNILQSWHVNCVPLAAPKYHPSQRHQRNINLQFLVRFLCKYTKVGWSVFCLTLLQCAHADAACL